VTPDGENQPWDRAHWAAKFAELAAQADGVGARLGIEFFPWADVSSLHDGLRLVEEAGQEAGTLFQDTVNRRRYCGEGAFDLAGMVAALRTGGRPGRGAWRSRPTSTGRCPSRRRWPARPRARVAC
jgi:sugar phosphate isomerase/epimerase